MTLRKNACMQTFDLKTWTNGDLFIASLAIIGPVCGLLLFSLQKWLFGRPMSERARQAGGSLFLSTYLKDYGYWWLHWPSRGLIAMRVHPTTVTLGGMGVVWVAAGFVGAGYHALGGLWILLGSLSDMLDGIVARERGLISREGEFIDSLVDRYSDLGLFGGLVIYLRHRPELYAWVLLAGAGAAMVSYVRAKAEALGVRNVPKGSMQRAERAVYLGFGIYFSPMVARHYGAPGDQTPYLAIGICVLIALLANISALRMARYTVAALRARGAPEAPAAPVPGTDAGALPRDALPRHA